MSEFATPKHISRIEYWCNRNMKYLYIQVEVKTRELEGKALLALQAVKNGWNVVIGRGDVLNEYMEQLPNGIYLAKNINKDKSYILEKIHSSGKKVFLSDEEAGLVQNDLNSYFDMRFNLENLKKWKKFF